MNEYSCIKKIFSTDDKIPSYVKKDVNNRINDWLRSGGSKTDNYIKRQYKYLLEFKANSATI